MAVKVVCFGSFGGASTRLINKIGLELCQNRHTYVEIVIVPVTNPT